MSNQLSDARLELEQLLNDGDTNLYTYVPEAAQPPAIVLLPASPYVQRLETDTYGTLTASFTLTLLVTPGPNNTLTDQMDELIINTIVTLINNGYDVEDVPTFYSYDVGTRRLLAADITTNIQINLT